MTVKTLHGWKQMSRCTCLQPPSHQADCPGRQGVIVLGEDNGGPSAREKLWAKLDEITAGLLGMKKADVNYAGVVKAEAATIAWCLALLDNPSEPDVNAVRKEAMRRWRDRQNG